MASLHPDIEAILREEAESTVPPAYALSPSGARDQHVENANTPDGPAVGAVRDLTIDGPVGDLPIRVYRPAGDGPFPVLLWMHGGGFVVGTLDTADHICRLLAVETDCVVVSVDYHLAPEHTFPTQPKECYAALEWTAEFVDTVGGDPERIAVGGDSAGGNLAAVTALVARDLDGPDLTHQLLVYPVTTDDSTLPSRRENAKGYGLTADAVAWFGEQYVRDAFDARHPYAHPLRARDHSDLPSATVVTAGFDPLRDDGHRYAERLRASGVPVTYREYEDMIHGFFGWFDDVNRAREAVADASADLRDAYSA